MTNQEIDILICEKLMGWKVKKSKFTKRLRLHNGSFFFGNLDDYRFSSDMKDASKILELATNGGFKLSSTWDNKMFTCEFWVGPYSSKGEYISASDRSLPKAICLAALKTRESKWND